MQPIRAASGFGCARHARAVAVLHVMAKATDCRRVGQRHTHSKTPADPPATATHIIATGTDPRGPSEPASSANRHSTIDAAMDAITARVAPLRCREAR